MCCGCYLLNEIDHPEEKKKCRPPPVFLRHCKRFFFATTWTVLLLCLLRCAAAEAALAMVVAALFSRSFLLNGIHHPQQKKKCRHRPVFFRRNTQFFCDKMNFLGLSGCPCLALFRCAFLGCAFPLGFALPPWPWAAAAIVAAAPCRLPPPAPLLPLLVPLVALRRSRRSAPSRALALSWSSCAAPVFALSALCVLGSTMCIPKFLIYIQEQTLWVSLYMGPSTSF